MSVSLTIIFVGIICASLSYAQEPFGDSHKEILMKSFDECSKSTSVDIEILKRARNSDFVEDQELKNYYACMFKHEHLNFMNDDGTFLTENVRSFLHLEGDKKLWDDIIDHCFEQVVNGDIPTAVYHTVICFTGKVGGKINL